MQIGIAGLRFAQLLVAYRQSGRHRILILKLIDSLHMMLVEKSLPTLAILCKTGEEVYLIKKKSCVIMILKLYYMDTNRFIEIWRQHKGPKLDSFAFKIQKSKHYPELIDLVKEDVRLALWNDPNQKMKSLEFFTMGAFILAYDGNNASIKDFIDRFRANTFSRFLNITLQQKKFPPISSEPYMPGVEYVFQAMNPSHTLTVSFDSPSKEQN